MDFITNIDLTILHAITDLQTDWLTPIMRVITALGDSGLFWIILSIILLFPRKTRWAGVCGLLSMALGFLVSNIALKNIVDRIRPYDLDPLINNLVTETDASFPSGHTTASFACAIAYFKMLPKRVYGVLAIILASLIAFSRLYLGVHYPSDVLAGVIIGLICSCVICWIIRKVKNRGPWRNL